MSDMENIVLRAAQNYDSNNFWNLYKNIDDTIDWSAVNKLHKSVGLITFRRLCKGKMYKSRRF